MFLQWLLQCKQGQVLIKHTRNTVGIREQIRLPNITKHTFTHATLHASTSAEHTLSALAVLPCQSNTYIFLSLRATKIIFPTKKDEPEYNKEQWARLIIYHKQVFQRCKLESIITFHLDISQKTSLISHVDECSDSRTWMFIFSM